MNSAWCLILLALAAGCGGSAPPPRSGFLDAPTSAVASQLAGRVQQVPVREGDAVHAGQLLAELDSREQKALVAQAQAGLERAHQSLKQAQANTRAAAPTVRGAGADIARARAALDEAQLQYQRVSRLVEQGAASSSQLDSARARLHEAQATLDGALASKATVSGKLAAAVAAEGDASAAVGSAQAALDLAQVRLSQSRIVSPFDGLVVELDLHAGEWAAPGVPIVTVEDLSRMWVRLDVGENEFGAIAPGRAAEIRVLAFPDRRFQGHVMDIGAEGEFALNRDVKRGQPDIRTFRVRVALDKSAPALRPGMTAEVHLDTRGDQHEGKGVAAR